MDENTRRQITWILTIGAILCVVVVASYRKTELKRLCGVIADGTLEQRIDAVRVLVAKQKLNEALEDQPRWVQDNAVAVIPLIGTNDAYYELLTCHAVLDAPAQARDQTVLSRLGRRGVETLIEAIQDKDATTRGTAKAPLVNIGKAIGGDATTKDNLVVEGCMELLDAWDQYVRDLVRDILSGIASPVVTGRLIPVMQQSEPGQKRMPDGTVRDQSTQEFMRAKGTAEASLIAMKVPALKPIVDNLLTFTNPEVRGNACRVLGVIADQTTKSIKPDDAKPVVEPLLGRLNTDDQWAVRRRAATALGLLADVAKQNGVVAPLIGHLSTDRAEVKAACVEALGRIADPLATGPLVSTLVNNRRGATTELRIALTALGEPAVPSIQPALASPEDEVRLIATQAIAQTGGLVAVEPLGSMLKDQSLAVRRVAADALRDIADERVLGLVAAALDDSDWQVYHAARDALAHVGPAAVPVLVAALGNANPRVCSMAQEALVRIGVPALAALQSALASGSATQAHWAAIALGGIGPDAVKDALAVLQNPASPVTARAQAALALGRMGAGDAVEPLMAAVRSQEPAVEIEALKALSALADERATPDLCQALTNPAAEVRDVAMDVLKDWRLGKVGEELAKVAASADLNAKRRAVIVQAETTTMAAHELLEQVSAVGQESVRKTPIDTQTLEQAATDVRETDKVRLQAIIALGYAGNAQSLRPMTTLLTPGNPYAAPAATAVARIGARLVTVKTKGAKVELSAAGKTLIDLMLATGDDDLRAKVAAGIGLMGEQPVATLLERLKSASPAMKPWILATLGAIGKPAVDPVLEARGASDDAEYKSWLASSLQLIGDAQALDLVKHLTAADQPKPEKYEPAQALLDRIRATAVR